MATAYLSGGLALPFSTKLLARVKADCTYTYAPMGEEPQEVQGYAVDGDWLWVPRQYGLEICNQLQITVEDDTSSGEAVVFPKIPDPRDYQEEAIGNLLDAFDSYYDVCFKASTGFGKTIVALIIAATLGRPTLVIVDQTNLADQWISALKDPNLFGLSDDQIGRVQGPECNYEGKLVTITMVQTLSSREYGEEFYRHFGFVIGDECHTLGSPVYSSVLQHFPATYRLWVSATPRRSDGLQKALEHNCGPVRVVASRQHAQSLVYVRRNPKVYSWYGNVSSKVGRILSEVAEDAPRNLALAKDIIWLWESGRDVLAIGDRIEHLRQIKSLLYYLGVPREEIGLYTGYDPVYSFMKDATPSKDPDGLEEGAEFTPVKFDIDRKRVSNKTLDGIKEKSTIILATYQKFAKGVDVPRLAGGVDVTPRGKAEQVQGRIQRFVTGKEQPIWITTLDENNYRLVHSFIGRITEYKKTDSQFFEWDGKSEGEQWHYRELMSQATELKEQLENLCIQKDKNGTNHLVEKTEAKKQKEQEHKKRILDMYAKAREQKRR